MDAAFSRPSEVFLGSCLKALDKKFRGRLFESMPVLILFQAKEGSLAHTGDLLRTIDNHLFSSTLSFSGSELYLTFVTKCSAQTSPQKTWPTVGTF